MYRGGMNYMRHSVSDTAEYGDYIAGDRIVTEETKKAMQKLLDEVKDGTFAKNWIAENKNGRPGSRSAARRRAISRSRASARDARMMPFLDAKEVLPGLRGAQAGGHARRRARRKCLSQERPDDRAGEGYGEARLERRGGRAEGAGEEAARRDLVNGKLVPWESATVHVSTHALHYGSSVFEGMRCYDTPKGPCLFRAKEHMRRFIDSGPRVPDADARARRADRGVQSHGARERVQGCVPASVGVPRRGSARRERVEDRDRHDHHGDAVGYLPRRGALENGVDVGISSWNRPGPNTIRRGLRRVGTTCRAAHRDGGGAARYHEGIALDVDGTVSEGRARTSSSFVTG
jgi:hypothetical protein